MVVSRGRAGTVQVRVLVAGRYKDGDEKVRGWKETRGVAFESGPYIWK